MQSILIVDDDRCFRGIARKLLEADGFEVGEADDGAAALAAVRELEPDVVSPRHPSSDIDGFEVAARLAAEDDGPAVVFTSTRDEWTSGPADLPERRAWVRAEGRTLRCADR